MPTGTTPYLIRDREPSWDLDPWTNAKGAQSDMDIVIVAIVFGTVLVMFTRDVFKG